MKFPQFKTCHVITNDKGILECCSPGFSTWTGQENEQLLGLSFFEVITNIHTRWGKILPKSLKECAGNIFLPLFDNDKQLATGLSLQITKHEHFYFITLVSTLAPHNLLKNSFLGDIPSQPRIITEMFLRLQTAESQLENYLQNFPGLFFNQRPDLSFSFLGPQAANFLGTNETLLHKTGSLFLKLIHELDRDFFLQRLEQEQTNSKSFSFTYRIKTPPSGDVKYILDVRTPLKTPGGILIGYEGVLMDVTRQALAEQRLSKSVWKDSLVQITNGLVHDFSNLMGGIFSLSELYLSQIDQSSSMHEGLTHIKKNTMQAQKLVRRIIDLHRESENQRSLTDLTTVSKDQIELAQVVIPRQIKLETNIPDHTLAVYMDEVLYRQTLLNLLLNARDSIKEQGTISVTITTKKKGSAFLKGTKSKDEKLPFNATLVSIKDTGCGIEKESLSKIFQPFYSTKDKNQGSGFGLYNAELFINDNHGFIGVNSTPNKGSHFFMYLPLTEY
jgi:signal transduction histidine kinase